MNTKLSTIAAALALIIGVMAVFAGGRVLLGTVPDYYVIDWLPPYNFAVGMMTVIVTAILIWKNSHYARPAAIATFIAHVFVMVVLLTTYREVVAPDSLVAMTVRIIVWTIILVLMRAAANNELDGQRA